MFCKKCGRILEEGTRFCGECGAPVSMATRDVINNQSNANEGTRSANNQQNFTQDYNQLDQSYDNTINPNMKKYAILSIVIPVISIIIIWNIGMAVYVAILLAALGFDCAKKGKTYNKTLSNIGYVLNGIFVGLLILGYIGQWILHIFA